MTFDVIVGNPPFGVAQKGSSPNLHLKIMNSIIKFCTNKLVFIMPSKPITKQLSSEWYNMFKNAVCNRVEVMDKGVFKGTNMDNTSIFYCDRNDKPENYCNKFDVDKAIYYAIDDEGHRLFVDKICLFKQIYPIICWDKRKRDNYYNKIKEDKFYLNVNNAGGFGAKWLSGTLKKMDVMNKEEEIGDLKVREKRVNIIECPNREYGENLKNLMVNGLVLRYGLWLTQTNQNIKNPQFKYVPDLDYTNIHTDEELLSICGFTPEEIENTMNYLKNFDFSKNRNDVVRKYNVNEIYEA